jgi:sugar phosphate isomerase/epimerase
VRRDGLEEFEILCEVAARLHIPVITLCTGTRDPVNIWKWHPDNDSKEAWDDMVQSIDAALTSAEINNLILAFEPESENVANSVSRARKIAR